MSDTKPFPLNDLVKTALFTALIIVGSKLSFALPGGVPFTVANFFVVLAGLAIGPWWGAASVGLFLLLGLAGLPVFSGTATSIAAFAGPTGGFLLGYLLSVIVAGVIAGRSKNDPLGILRISLGAVAGTVAVYIPGLPWFTYWAMSSKELASDKAMELALAKAAIPFVLPDLIKTIMAVAIAPQLRRLS